MKWLTPIEEHFVLHRSNTPELSADEWTVSVTGMVDEEVELSKEVLQEEFPTTTVAHTMECAGNCRAYFDPAIESVAWEFDGVSTAIWSGTPLESVLSRYGANTEDGMWVTAIGGDDPKDGDDVFARSIPMSKILRDCILAYEMNDRDLPKEHGYPLRLIVPGWYGVNSVKWLNELHVMEKMVYGPEWDARRDGDLYYTRWQQERYRIAQADERIDPQPTVSTFDTWEQLESPDIDHPFTFDQNVMSLIGYPAGNDSVSPREDGCIEIVGTAWAGDDEVTEIEVSVDGGETWYDGEFISPPCPNAWRLFRYVWDADTGTYEIVSRATDEHGRRQPATIATPEDEFDGTDDETYPWNRRGYGANAYMPLSTTVEVVESGRSV